MTTLPGWQVVAQSQLGGALKQLSPLGGGDFAQAWRATLDDGTVVFIKTHEDPPPNFFATEATGLTWLRDTKTVLIPEVLAVSDDPPFLALQWIDTGRAFALTDRDFGRSLAALHKNSGASFGRGDNRTTGSLALPNAPCSTWAEFYASQRLIPLAKIASDRRVLERRALAVLEALSVRLAELGGPPEPPSLLHGDLWAGNRVTDKKGQSWLIDPAAHFGHREFDLAMMRLFGGFSDACFGAYEACYPLAAGWQDRVALHQLAPLIVHAIKFGGSYIGSTEDALRQYG